MFCLPRGNYSLAPSYGSYLCKSAIGVADLSTTKTGNHTLISLGDGDDYAEGFSDSPNIFLVTGGPKNLYGGSKEDIFVLQGDNVTGFISGKDGIDTLDLTAFASNAKGLDVYLQTGKIMHESFRDNVLRVRNVERVLGRKNKADRIFSACNTHFINGQGGNEGSEDYINIFRDNDCVYEVQVVIRPNTLVNNHALGGHFHYTVPYGLGSAKVDFMRSHRALKLNNTFTFEYEPVEIRSIDARNERVLNRTLHTISFNFSPIYIYKRVPRYCYSLQNSRTAEPI